ncbi:MAG: S8 family serine peptidase [Phycisphaerae bacterium]
MTNRVLMLATCAGALSAPALAQCVPPDAINEAAIANQLMVRVAPGFNDAHVLTLVNQHYPGATVIREIDGFQTYLMHLPLPAGQDICFAAEFLEDLYAWRRADEPEPGVPMRWAEANYAGQASNGSTGTIYDSRPVLYQANYMTQYAVDSLGVTVAHPHSTGRGTVVAIVDTGIDSTHPDLAGRMMAGGYNFISMSPATLPTQDGINNDGDGATDELWVHGTYVAGLVALVAPEARLLPVVALNDDGASNNFVIAQAIYYAVEQGADVINLSCGSTYESEVVFDVIQHARENGVVCVGAAGNRGGLNVSIEEAPAVFQGCVGVAGVNAVGVRAAFSNYHTDLDLCAPAVSRRLPGDPSQYDEVNSIYSTIPGGIYGIWEGTSVAAPFVSATAALIISQETSWQRDANRADSTMSRMFSTSLNIDGLNPPQVQNQIGRLLRTGLAAQQGPVQPLQGDLNRDRAVDLQDLALMLRDFGLTDSLADVNMDGSVGLVDLAYLLINFGL